MQAITPPDFYINSKWVNCEKCEGKGGFYESHCCGADAEDGFCVDCKEICESDLVDCQECEGTGQVEILID